MLASQNFEVKRTAPTLLKDMHQNKISISASIYVNIGNLGTSIFNTKRHAHIIKEKQKLNRFRNTSKAENIRGFKKFFSSSIFTFRT